jgi:hypothetical protein
VFGRLTVEARGPDVGSDRTFECRCECGNTVTVRKTHLYGGRQKSCGCLKREMVTANNTTHGHSAKGKITPEFRAWLAMRNRCDERNAKCKSYYFDRGIRVCEEWQHDFAAFFAHIGPRPSPRYTVDRIDNDKGYEPGNVRWATPSEQRLNQRRMLA